MKLVTVAHVTFNRIGSASTHAMVRHNEVRRVREVPDGSPETLRELVITIAEEEGESRTKLQAMWQENPWNYSQPNQQPGTIVFNIQGPGMSVQYGAPYAVCYAHPALKIGDR